MGVDVKQERRSVPSFLSIRLDYRPPYRYLGKTDMTKSSAFQQTHLEFIHSSIPRWDQLCERSRGHGVVFHPVRTRGRQSVFISRSTEYQACMAQAFKVISSWVHGSLHEVSFLGGETTRHRVTTPYASNQVPAPKVKNTALKSSPEGKRGLDGQHGYAKVRLPSQLTFRIQKIQRFHGS